MRALVVLLLLAPGCYASHGASDAGPLAPNAQLTPACGPTDGPATSLRVYFGGSVPACGSVYDGQIVEVLIVAGPGATLPLPDGLTVTSTMRAPLGYATICPGRGAPCEVTSDFTLRIDTTRGGLTTGRLDYGTRGGFSPVVAESCPRMGLCG
jgi:hypothetical protein